MMTSEFFAGLLDFVEAFWSAKDGGIAPDFGISMDPNG
jgi:hypothetical protein